MKGMKSEDHFFKISKAFTKVWQSVIIFKLKHNGFRKQTVLKKQETQGCIEWTRF